MSPRRAAIAGRSLRRAFLPGAALLAAFALGGCGSSARSSTLDTAPIQRAIAHSILVQRNIATTVECPSRVARKAGVRFICTATLDVGSYPVSVTETSASGHVRYADAAPLVILDMSKVKSAIARSILAQRHLRAIVACPTTVIQRAGVRFGCVATLRRGRYGFVVTETNARGQIHYVAVKRIAVSAG